jgi:hypothetical protein
VQIKKSIAVALSIAAFMLGNSPYSLAATKSVKATPKPIPVVKVIAPAVKKSVNNLCHAKGSRYYDQTKKFTAYKTIKDCLKSGGKLPKK